MPAKEDPTERARRVWDAYAHRYDRDIGLVDRTWFRGGREWVCSRARGDVLEVAVGTGRNLPHYPPAVSLTGVDLSPAMLAIARTRAAGLRREVDLREADAQRLPMPDRSFDTVVCTLSLCAVPDHRAALAEMARVLRPGGRLLLLDHVASTWWPLRAGQRLVEALSIRLAGEHLTRRPLPMLAGAGLVVEEAQRLRAGTVERVAAVKPDEPAGPPGHPRGAPEGR
jgi:ubiquinone/menaquinone biosynthesis C-methylase UbiE